MLASKLLDASSTNVEQIQLSGDVLTVVQWTTRHNNLTSRKTMRWTRRRQSKKPTGMLTSPRHPPAGVAGTA
jgi:hypothetical protein